MGNQVGAFVSRSVAGPLALGQDPTFTPMIALLTERGPAHVPTLITSLARFKQLFGGAVSHTAGRQHSAGYETLKACFAKGVRRVYVLRLVGGDAAQATITIDDRDAAPEPTLTVTSRGPDAALNGYKVVIANGTRANTFRLTLTDAADRIIETFDNLKMDATSLEQVNSLSSWIALANEGSPTAAPANMPAIGTVALAGGVDDNDPSPAEIVGTAADGVKTGLHAFRSLKHGPGFVCAPDMDTDPTVRAELIDQSERFFRLVFTSTAPAATVAQAKTTREGWDAFNVSLYYPRVRVRDELDGAVKSVPAIGWVMADYLRAIERDGPGKAPGGRDFRVDAGALGMETQLNGQPLVDEGVAEELVGRGINPIWDRDGSGARVWGARAASNDPAWTYLHAAYLWCRIGYALKTQLDQLTLDIADPLFFNSVQDGIYIYMSDLYVQRAFAGARPGPRDTADPATHAFGVQCDETLLTPADRANGNVRAVIWFRPAWVAETIYINIAKQNEVA